MELLHPYLDELAQTAQPLGLATFGEVPSAERRLLTVLQTLRKPLLTRWARILMRSFYWTPAS